MNVKLFAAFLCLSAASTGCIYVEHDGGGGGSGPCCETSPSPIPTPTPTPQRSGDVTFLWTFGNIGAGRCADVPDVKKIRITIPGEDLHNGGIYACSTAGVDGIVLHDFLPSSYGYTLEALDYTDKVLYAASGKFTVNGDVRVNVNLAPGSGGGGGGGGGGTSAYAYVGWAFEASTTSTAPNCTQAGVTHVDVRLDGKGDWTRFTCTEGFGTNRMTSPYLAPGTHTLELKGLKVNGTSEVPYYYRSGTMKLEAGSPADYVFTLNAVGGLSVRWELINGSLSKTCAEAGVSKVNINFQDSTGAWVYGGAKDVGDVQSCVGAPILYQYLRPGTYKVFVRGLNASDQLLYSNENYSPPALTVKAFEQKTKEDAVTIYVQKK